jgi:hypothetical protein
MQGVVKVLPKGAGADGVRGSGKASDAVSESVSGLRDQTFTHPRFKQ